MSMYNPPHPGEFIKEVYLDPFHFSYRNVAAKLKVWLYAFQKHLAVVQRVGWLCRTTIIFGRRDRPSTWKRLKL